MKFETWTFAAGLLVLTAACSAPASDTSAGTEPASVVTSETVDKITPVDLSEVSAGAYSLEKTHAFLTFKVGHSGGISQYRVNFTDFDAKLDFNPEDPAASTLVATVNPLGVETNYPGDYKAGHADSQWSSWNEDVARDPKWLNADAHPEIKFEATSAVMTGESTGDVTGDLTFLGQTKPVTLSVTYNGVANPPWFGERDLIGFNAETVITRSEWGMGAYIPGITDDVTVSFSGEFLQDE